VLAVTGTNGKTTVTALTGQLVERAGKTVAVAGNIGPTLLDTLRSHLDADTCRRSGCSSCPASSWPMQRDQCVPVTGTVADAATVLNLTQDHLDWHGDMAAYVQAKARCSASRR
jgi:UDP-N-acetylmuramoylalanine--D-glutamate ligase